MKNTPCSLIIAKDFPPLCYYSKAGVKYILILMFLVYPSDASSEVATGCFPVTYKVTGEYYLNLVFNNILLM